jgi:NADPH:quinone reductase-like Zn-dependent oxidoreductase
VCDESLNSLKPSGRLMITGVTSWYQNPFNLSSLQGRPMTLLGSGARSRRSFAAMMPWCTAAAYEAWSTVRLRWPKPAKLMRSPRGEISSANWCCEFRKHSVRVALFLSSY